VPYEQHIRVRRHAAGISRFEKRPFQELHDMSHEDTRLTSQSRIAEIARLVTALLVLICATTPVITLAQEVPAVEKVKPVTGSVETGYRWRWLAGNEDLYRSTINLGSGPKVNSFSTTYAPAPNQAVSFLDRFAINGAHWGGEPYSTLNASAGLSNRYELRVNYKRFDYFNAVPSFANPTQARAGLTQSTQDINQRIFDSQLTLRPNAQVSPFFAYDFDAARGPGTTNFVQDSNEYTVATNIDNATHTYRGGVALKFNLWSGGVEAGGSTFHDDQQVNVNGLNTGNRATLFLGQQLELDSLNQAYKIQGRDRFIRSYGEIHALQKVTVTGEFSYSRPTSSTRYTDVASGNFVLLDTLQMFTGQQTLTLSDARYPHPSGNIGVEFRPSSRVRIVQTVSIDRFKISGNADTTRTLDSTDTLEDTDSSTLKAAYTRERLDAMIDLTSYASVHAGYSFLAATATSPGSVLVESETRDLNQNQADLGLALRIHSRFRANVEFQNNRGDAVFFRTDQLHFWRVRARGRYQINPATEVGVSTTIWNNDNDVTNIRFFEKTRETSVDLAFFPGTGRKLGLSASYTRGTFRSDLPFIVPQNIQVGQSIYRDRGHTGSFSFTVNPTARLRAEAGGTFFISTSPLNDGTQTRPTRFYNPTGRLTFQTSDTISLVAEWDWHAYANRAFPTESYHANLLTTGIAYKF
jgi:hypothetical protein